MADESLTDFVRAALNLGDAARYVIDGEPFGHAELLAALAEFAVVNRAMDESAAEPAETLTTRT
jgi:hypothetical protein